MRIGGRVPVVLAAAAALTLIGGVAGAAVASHSSSAKACVTSSGALRLRSGGKCATGEKAITLDSRGPAGARGPRGPRGPAGADGDAVRIDFSQTDPEASTVTHALATSGPATLIASCQGTAATTTSLVLTLNGGTDPLSYTASVVSSPVDDGTTPAAAVLDQGSSASLTTTSLPTLTTTSSVSDIVTIVIAAQSGEQITGTLDVELSTADSPACAVNGTLASA
ncbi:MAG TPA: hypothetical protein VME70_10275 [Mycobacteriales bacterium]|nr:hypothetical protein [Mycobacteriales bacterium]